MQSARDGVEQPQQQFHLNVILDICLNSLTANSVLAGEKLILFGRHVQDFDLEIIK